MAANLSAEEAREIILNGEDDDELSEPDNDENLREKLLHLLDNFDGGPKFNHGFFRDNAIRLLIPVAELSQKEINDATDLQAFRIISENYNPLPLLREESKYWLKAIYRRLGSRNRIRTPYYADIKRYSFRDFWFSHSCCQERVCKGILPSSLLSCQKQSRSNFLYYH